MNPSLLPSLAWFARIAQHKSFTRAAEEMGVSRAALSQNLKALERQLGVRLLHRTTRDMSLTEAGQQLFDALRPALGSIAQAVSGLDEIGGVPSGLVRINTSRLAYRVLVEPHLSEFCRRHPLVKLEFVLSDELANIVGDGSDLGIRLGRSLAEHVVAVPISPPVAMAVVAAPAYLARHGTPKTPSDLASHACINYRFAGSGAVREWDFTEPGKAARHFTQGVAGSLTFNDDLAMTQAALQGLGLMQIVDLAVHEHVAQGRLLRVLKNWTHQVPGFHLYSPSREHVPARVRAVQAFLRELREQG